MFQIKNSTNSNRTRLIVTIVLFNSCCSVLFCQSNDTTKLPFAIAHEKKLSDEDLKDKKEGFYLTGIPNLSVDPISGFGIGGEGSLFFNAKRTDPFFAYTPYRAQLEMVLFVTSKKQKEITFILDVPYIFNTKWRLRTEAAYENNPNLLYFGITPSTLNKLYYFTNNDSSTSAIQTTRYNDYKNQLTGSNSYYNTYIKDEYILNMSGERSYLNGKLRLLAGFEFAKLNISKLGSNSLLANDAKKKQIIGFGKSTVIFAQFGIIYDTRDLEADPGKGIFFELTDEWSNSAFGSDFKLNKTFIHFNWYKNLIASKPKKLILALRIGGGYTAGSAPFFEYQDQWSSEGSIEGLGGSQTLRGYKQARFLARTMTFNNLEFRYRFAKTKFLKQQLVFSAVPFIDAGEVSDSLSGILKLKNYRYDEGLGLRIAWNVNTVLRFDYAFSKEDNQFFFNLAHAF